MAEHKQNTGHLLTVGKHSLNSQYIQQIYASLQEIAAAKKAAEALKSFDEAGFADGLGWETAEVGELSNWHANCLVTCSLAAMWTINPMLCFHTGAEHTAYTACSLKASRAAAAACRFDISMHPGPWPCKHSKQSAAL